MLEKAKNKGVTVKMKKSFAALLALVLLCTLIPLAQAETWYCPQCGNRNEYNFCPVCGTAKPAQPSPGGGASYTRYANIRGTLNSKLATRTGPSTTYDEPGSFFSAGTSVTVLSRAYDQRNEIWWVQVEFQYQGRLYRAYTGVKRFNGLNLSAVPEEYQIGACTLGSSIVGFYGPGPSYAAISRRLPSQAPCRVFGYGNSGSGDYVQIECYDEGLRQYRRAWVPVSAVTGLHFY